MRPTVAGVRKVPRTASWTMGGRGSTPARSPQPGHGIRPEMLGSSRGEGLEVFMPWWLLSRGDGRFGRCCLSRFFIFQEADLDKVIID